MKVILDLKHSYCCICHDHTSCDKSKSSILRSSGVSKIPIDDILRVAGAEPAYLQHDECHAELGKCDASLLFNYVQAQDLKWPATFRLGRGKQLERALSAYSLAIGLQRMSEREGGFWLRVAGLPPELIDTIMALVTSSTFANFGRILSFRKDYEEYKHASFRYDVCSLSQDYIARFGVQYVVAVQRQKPEVSNQGYTFAFDRRACVDFWHESEDMDRRHQHRGAWYTAPVKAPLSLVIQHGFLSSVESNGIAVQTFFDALPVPMFSKACCYNWNPEENGDRVRMFVLDVCNVEEISVLTQQGTTVAITARYREQRCRSADSREEYFSSIYAGADWQRWLLKSGESIVQVIVRGIPAAESILNPSIGFITSHSRLLMSDRRQHGHYDATLSSALGQQLTYICFNDQQRDPVLRLGISTERI